MYDVVIVGCGPVGATLANILGATGARVAVIEKDTAVYPLPRAIHFDGEVMRVFESAGLRPAIETITRPGLQGMHFLNAKGETLMIRGGTAANGPNGCANNYYFHQPELEQVLRQGMQRFENVVFLPGHEVTRVRENSDSVELDVLDSRAQKATSVSAAWVVGCDGARSLIRRVLGSDSEDLGLHQPWLVFDVLLNGSAPDLPAYTVQHCEPARPMTYCNVTGRRRRWEIMLMPGDDPAKMVEPEHIWSIVNRWLAPGQAQIERATIYTFHSLIARGWRKGRLLIAGDSAHQTPPFLGQGMCAGIRDAANLGWKLAAVMAGQSDAGLLDSYESERSPHVRAFIELAVRLGDVIQTTDPLVAEERDRRLRAGNPAVFEFPAPGLGPGLKAGNHPKVGQIFPQPTLSNGIGLDRLIGSDWAIISRHGSRPTGTVDRLWAGWPVRWLVDDEPALRQWLDQEHANAVVIRPDRYIAGVIAADQSLDELAVRLHS